MTDLNYFVGKTCTILTTHPINIEKTADLTKGMAAERHAQYYTGEVVFIDEQGIWIKHLVAQTLAYYKKSFIVGIVEEKPIAADDPIVSKIKEEISKKKEPVKPPVPSSFIPVDQLTKMVRG